jgi:hypothetical protein
MGFVEIQFDPAWVQFCWKRALNKSSGDFLNERKIIPKA